MTIHLYGRLMSNSNVYILLASSGALKIGRAVNVRERLKTIATSCPYTLEVAYTREIDPERALSAERIVHSMLAEFGMEREWFRCSLEDAKSAVDRAVEAAEVFAPKRIDPVKLSREEGSPVHPGEILREDILPALNMPVSTAADRLGVTRQALHRVLSGKASISPEMALRLGRFCGNGPDVWLRMQGAYDLWHAERSISADLSKITAAEAA